MPYGTPLTSAAPSRPPDMWTKRLSLLLPALLLAGCGTFADPTEWFEGEATNPPSPLVELDNRVEPRRKQHAGQAHQQEVGVAPGAGLIPQGGHLPGRHLKPPAVQGGGEALLKGKRPVRWRGIAEDHLVLVVHVDGHLAVALDTGHRLDDDAIELVALE